MKSKKLISTILALLLALQCIVPAFASEADTPPEAGEAEEETLPPEDPEEDLPETPPEAPVPQEPEETQPPEDAQEPGEDQGPEGTQPSDAVQDQPEGGPGPEDIPDAAEEPPEPDAVPLEDLIDVLVPSSGQMILNPYRLPVDLEGGETTDQIVHSCQTLINQSDFPVTVNVTVTGTVPAESEAAFVSAPPSPDAPDKDVFLYVEFQPYPDWWEGSYYGLSNQLLVSERGSEGENVLTLDAQGEGYFRLFGAMSEGPEELWSETDIFGAVLTFTFTPVYTDPVETEEPESPEGLLEEEPPEEAEDPDVPEEVLPEEPTDPKPPEELPPEDPVTPDAPEEVPPEDPEEGPDVPEEAPPESPEDPGAPEETPPEEAESPDVPTGPEAPAGPDATLPAVQDNE